MVGLDSSTHSPVYKQQRQTIGSLKAELVQIQMLLIGHSVQDG